MDIKKENNTISISGNVDEILILLLDAEHAVKALDKTASEGNLNTNEYSNRTTEYKRAIYETQILAGYDPNEF